MRHKCGINSDHAPASRQRIISTRPYNLFINYAHENEAVKDRLKNYLDPLICSGLIGTCDSGVTVNPGSSFNAYSVSPNF